MCTAWLDLEHLELTACEAHCVAAFGRTMARAVSKTIALCACMNFEIEPDHRYVRVLLEMGLGTPNRKGALFPAEFLGFLKRYAITASPSCARRPDVAFEGE